MRKIYRCTPLPLHIPEMFLEETQNLTFFPENESAFLHLSLDYPSLEFPRLEYLTLEFCPADNLPILPKYFLVLVNHQTRLYTYFVKVIAL